MPPVQSVVTTPISIVFPEGDARARFSPASALARPRRRLIDEGVDPGAIVYLAAETPEGDRHVLGILGATAGDRLRFFPGITEPLLITYPRAGHPARVLATALDHLTLDVGSRTARFAGSDGRGRALSGILGRRPEVAPDVVRWFGFMVPALDRLEPLPGMPWRSDGHGLRDPGRRMALLRRASRAVTFPLPTPPPRTCAFIDFQVDLAPATPRPRTPDTPAAASSTVYDVPNAAGTATLRIACRILPAFDEPAFALCV